MPFTLRQQSVWWCCLLVSQGKTHITVHELEQPKEGIEELRYKHSEGMKIDAGNEVGIERKWSCWRNSCAWECECPCCLRDSRCAAGGTRGEEVDLGLRDKKEEGVPEEVMPAKSSHLGTLRDHS